MATDNLTLATTGCYYVRARKNGFAVYHQSFQNGKKTDTMVAPLAYPTLGFSFDWTFEEAKNRCSSLNKEKTLVQSKAREAAKRIIELQSVDKILFNEERVKLFQKKLEEENEGTEAHLKKICTHFLKIQKLCNDLKILPHDYKDSEKRIYKWFSHNKVSLDYTQKLISLLNRWGSFTSRLDSRFFEPIRPVRGISRQNIKKAHKEAVGIRTESKPLTPELLANKRTLLSEENYNFLFLTVWLGVRPQEAKLFKNFNIQTNNQGLQFVVVYQTKLNQIDENDRYKAIPLLLPEQKICWDLIKSEKISAPSYKTMRNVFGERYGLYAGRKGFTDLMLSKDFKVEDISLWHGHTSIETTWKHYKNKDALKLPSPK